MDTTYIHWAIISVNSLSYSLLQLTTINAQTTVTLNLHQMQQHHMGAIMAKAYHSSEKRQKWFKMRWSIKYILLAWWLKKLICWYKYMGRSQDLPIFGHIIWSVKGPVKFQNGLWFHYSFLISNNIFSVVQMKKW